MPGSNEYSMDPEFISEGSSTSTDSPAEGVVSSIVTAPTSKPVAAPKPSPFYQQQDFRKEKLEALKGLMSERRADRVVNRYMKSEAGKQAEADFARAESQKYMASVDAYLQAGKDRRAAIGKPAVAQTPAEPTLVSKSTASVPAAQRTPINTASQTRRVGGINWDQRAREYGFKDQAEVAKWQATQPGLVVDGKFGDKSIARWQASQQQAQQGQTRTIDMPYSSLHGMEIPVVNQNAQPAVTQPAQTQPAAPQAPATQTSGYTPKAFTLQDFNTHKHFRNPYHGHRTVTVDGKVYPIRVTTGLYGKHDIDNDQMYAFDEATGMIRKVDETMIGFPSGQGFAKGSQWIHPRFFYEEQWLQHNTAPAKRGPLGGGLTKEYEDWYHNQYHPASKAGFRKQGGTMNRINYFQQGGAYPRYDLTKHPNFRMPHYKHPGQVTMDGKTYPMRVTTGMWNPWGIPLNNDESYAIDPETGKVRQLDENIFGRTTGKWAKDSEWKHVPILHRDLWRKHNPKATFDTEDDLYGEAILGLDLGYLRPEDLDSLDNRAKTKKHQQGGTMTAQQDIKAQVTALVQAAMQGDKKANQQVNQIMEAAKAGNQQAMQLAQMIAEVAKQLQGQATAAKWGAKLNYIQSLKFAKGGKTCPACKKKVETKACGGKKAKKHQEGGWLELLPIYGTYQAGKRFYKNPSWRTAGEFGLNFLGDAAMLSGIGLGAKAAVTGLRAAALAGKVGKVGKTTMEGLKTARQFAKTQKTMGRMSEAAARNFVKTGAPVASPLPANFRVPEQVFRNVVDAGLKQDRIADTFIDATRAAKAATGAGAAGMVAKVGALE